MSTTTTSNDAKQAGSYLKEKLTIGLTRFNKDEVMRALMKVTSHKLKAPNEKHMVRLIAATVGEYNAGSTKYDDVNKFIVEELEKRTHTHSWIVVLKTLVVLHRLLTEGSSDVARRIQENRNIFVLRHMKELGDTPDGAMQARFIAQYTRYLEERCCCQRALGLSSRVETAEFAEALAAMDVEQLTPAYDALLLAAETLGDIEYSDRVVDNAATHDAFTRVLKDSSRIYVVLAERLLYVLHTFETYPVRFKEQWITLIERTERMNAQLKKLFEAMRSSKVVFELPIPRIEPLPKDALQHLREDLEYSRVPKESLSALLGAEAVKTLNATPASPAAPTRQDSDMLGEKPQQAQAQQPQQVNNLSALFAPVVAPSTAAAPAAAGQPRGTQPSPFAEAQPLDLFSQGAWGGSGAAPQPQFGAPVINSQRPQGGPAAAAFQPQAPPQQAIFPDPFSAQPPLQPAAKPAAPPKVSADFDPFDFAAPAPAPQSQAGRAGGSSGSSGGLMDFFAAPAPAQRQQAPPAAANSTPAPGYGQPGRAW